LLNESLAKGHQRRKKAETKTEGEAGETSRKMEERAADDEQKKPAFRTGEIAGGSGCTPDQ
jgi:hypothetical protein